MAQSLVLSINVCRGIGISPLRVITFGWVFLRPTFVQDRHRNYFFRGFWKVWNFFSKIRAHSERYRNLLAGIFEILTLMETSRFHWHRSKPLFLGVGWVGLAFGGLRGVRRFYSNVISVFQPTHTLVHRKTFHILCPSFAKLFHPTIQPQPTVN